MKFDYSESKGANPTIRSIDYYDMSFYASKSWDDGKHRLCITVDNFLQPSRDVWNDTYINPTEVRVSYTYQF